MISTQLNRHHLGTAVLCAAAVIAGASLASAQTRPSLPPNSPFLGGVPETRAVAESLSLSPADIIERALQHNLGVLLSEQGGERAAGARAVALAAMLPNVTASASASRRKNNLEAFGFPLGDSFPRLVGPFNVYEARVFLSQSLFDLKAINEIRAETHTLAAARQSYRGARDIVVLVAANAYLQTLATSARSESVKAQLETADALHRQAQSLRTSGLVAGIDVVRAEVRLSTERQRAIAAENEYEKSKLQLARVIGLPIGQTFTLRDEVPAVPMPELKLEDALERA